MTFNQWQQVKTIVQTALEIEPEKRARFVAENCSDDLNLRREVESLLASYESAGDFIEAPAFIDKIEMLASKDSSTELKTGERVGRFEIRSLIGRGGMGAVYLAKDTRLNRKVALKALPEKLTTDEQSKQRFIREAKATSALNHPHIITIYDIVSDGERDFIAMEYVEGETFRDLLYRGKLEIKRVVDLVAQAASGLAAAHEAGIIHRDIKPENLMVNRDSQVKILDFGLAKLVENQRVSLADSSAETAHYSEVKKIETVRGVIIGTVAYMSPEQAEGHTLNHRTDIFSLGVVFYEMLTGKKPFEGKSTIDTLHSIINEEPRPAIELNPQLPAEVAELLGKAMAKDPRERYQHAGDFELDLRRFKRALETNSLISSRAQLTAKPGARKAKASLYWIAALSILALIAVAALWMWQRAKSSNVANTPRGISLEKAMLTPITVDAGFEGELHWAE